jgi:hypothetical protein
VPLVNLIHYNLQKFDFYKQNSIWRDNFTYQEVAQIQLNPNPYLNDSVKMYSGTPYPFGVDPVRFFNFT